MLQFQIRQIWLSYIRRLQIASIHYLLISLMGLQIIFFQFVENRYPLCCWHNSCHFSGERNNGDMDTFQEWIEQFEMIASVCGWSARAKLINLVTRLRGQAYAFFRSCSMQNKTRYALLVAELHKRFTPVHLQAVQSSLFHD